MGLCSGAGGKRRSAQQIIDLVSYRLSGTGLYQHPQTLDRHGIALRHRSLRPEALHQRLPAESLHHLLDRGAYDAQSNLCGVILQAIAVAAEGEGPGDISEQSFLLSVSAVGIYPQGQAQLVEQIDRRDLPGPSHSQLVQRGHHSRQHIGVVEGVVRATHLYIESASQAR